MQTTRILIAIDVPTDQLSEVYGDRFSQPGTLQERDLAESLKARLQEFYPANDGYATPVNVTSVVVDTHDSPVENEAVAPISDLDLRGIYAVGVEGVE